MKDFTLLIALGLLILVFCAANGTESYTPPYYEGLNGGWDSYADGLDRSKKQKPKIAPKTGWLFDVMSDGEGGTWYL